MVKNGSGLQNTNRRRRRGEGREKRRSREMTQREAEIDIDVEGEEREREEEIESEGRRRCRRRRRRRRLGLRLGPRLTSGARAKVEVGETRARNITPEFHAVYVAFVALLHGHIQLLYQHGDDSPFQTHPISMRISVVAICVYGLAALFGHAQFCSNYSQIFDYVIMVSGALYPVSLISVFIPNGLSCLLYIIWLIFSVVVVPWNFLVCSSQWILQMSRIALFNMTTYILVFKLLAYKALGWAVRWAVRLAVRLAMQLAMRWAGYYWVYDIFH
ncbi:hypothetical protein ACSBR2_004517 [Camellia fascicularis]